MVKRKEVSLQAAIERADFGLWAFVFVAAFLLRAGYLIDARRSYPFFSHFIVDAADYNAWGRAIAQGEWFGRRVFYLDPLYAYFLAFLYTLSNGSTLFVRWVQIAVGSASCVLVAETARRVARDRRAGFVAGLIAAAYGMSVFYEGTLLKESLVVFFGSAVLLALVVAVQNGSSPAWAWAGGLTGALVLTRSNALILAPLVAAWLLVRRRGGRSCAFFVGAFLASLLPAVANNYVASGDLVLTVSKAGQLFYIGNNLTSDGVFQPLISERQDTSSEEQDARAAAEAAEGRRLKPSEVSRYWLRRSLRDISRRPGAWARLLARKARLFIAAYEIPDTEDYYLAQRTSPTLRLAFLSFGLLLPSALIGWTWLRTGPEAELLVVVWGGNALSVALFFVLARYRLPGIPAMIVCAAVFATGLFDRWKGGLRGGVAATLVCWLGLYGISRAADLVGVPGQVAVASWVNLGELYRSDGDYRKADAAFRAALEYAPDDAMVLNSLGASLADQGRLEEAADAYRRALARQPAYAKAHFNLGNVLSADGRRSEAAREYRLAYSLDPSLNAAGLNLANLLAQDGQVREAAELYEKIVAADPANATARYDRGLLLLGRDPGAAIAEFRKAIDLAPRYAKAYDGLGVALARTGDRSSARKAFLKALEIDPNDAAAHANLGAER